MKNDYIYLDEDSLFIWLKDYANSLNENSDLKNTLAYFIRYYNASLKVVKDIDFGTYVDLKDGMPDYSMNGTDFIECRKVISYLRDKKHCSDSSIEAESFLNLFRCDLKNIGIVEDISFLELYDLFDGNIDKEGSFVNIWHDKIIDYLGEKYGFDKDKSQDVYDVFQNALISYNRYTNLRAKMAHTARMLMICENQMASDENKDFPDDFKNMTLMSVLYHDIGRMYQGVYYPDLYDKRVQDNEKDNSNGLIIRSHGEIGYYFSMQNLLVNDIIHAGSNEQLRNQFLMHSLASFAVKYHQRSNALELGHMDIDYKDIKNITNEEKSNVSKLMLDIYKNSPMIDISANPLHGELQNHINGINKFTNETANDIIKCICLINLSLKSNKISEETKTKINGFIEFVSKYYLSHEQLTKVITDPNILINDPSFLASSFGIDTSDVRIPDFSNIGDVDNFVNDQLEVLRDKISNRDFPRYLNDIFMVKNSLKDKRDFNIFSDYTNNCFFESLIKNGVDKDSYLNEVIDWYNEFKNNNDDKDKYFELLNNILSKYGKSSDELFNDMFKVVHPNSDIESLELLHQYGAASLTLTTDIDKMDIFNQRANGSWELTNGSHQDVDTSNPNWLDNIIDDEYRENFYRGEKCLGGNKIKVLWFHCNQFVATNLRNRGSFESLKDSNVLDLVCRKMIDMQDEGEVRDKLTPYIVEPIAYSNFFIDYVLKTRVDENGNLISPIVDEEFNIVESNIGTYPSLLDAGKIDKLRKESLIIFREKWDKEKDKIISDMISEDYGGDIGYTY